METTVIAARNALRSRSGGATIEYALLAAMIAIAAAVGVAPFGGAIAQEFSVLSRDHLFGAEAADASHSCRRVEWSEVEVRQLAEKDASERHHHP